MRKIVSLVLVLIIILIVVFLLFSNKETTLKEEGFGSQINSSKVNEIEIIRGSDDKTIILKDGQAEELFNMLIKATLITPKNTDKEFTKTYWITVRENGVRNLGMVIDDTLVLKPYDYNENAGSKKNAQHYVFEDDSILNFIETLFEQQ